VNYDGTFGKEYGYDPVMFYGDFYFPHVGQGMDRRVGRYISIPDIEAQLAPNNYTYSHSLLYRYDCYTQVGLMTTTKLSNHWLVQAGVSPGCDVAPWDSTDAKLTLTLGFQYTWNDGNGAIYPVMNALNDGKYAYNNLNSMLCDLEPQVSRSPIPSHVNGRLVHVGEAGTKR
jgi:Putative beta-barrel porin-2, OmpL-like. bbp2